MSVATSARLEYCSGPVILEAEEPAGPRPHDTETGRTAAAARRDKRSRRVNLGSTIVR
jgi:hypothetical protein